VLVILPEADVPWRVCVAFGLGTCSMWCVASLAFLLSSLVENSIGPIIGTMSVIIVFLIISSMPVDLFVTIRPYLFTTYFTVWQKIFEEPVPWATILFHVCILSLFSVGFYLVTWYIFVRKDILS
jgi:ABC-2 type transport system permease protein